MYLEIHRLQRELQRRRDQRLKVHHHILAGQILAAAHLRHIPRQLQAHPIDLRIKHVALVEPENNALLVLVQAQLQRRHRIVVRRIRIRSDRDVHRRIALDRIVDRFEEIVLHVEGERSDRRRIGLHLAGRVPAAQKQVGEGDAVVPGVVDVIVARVGEQTELHGDDDQLDDLDEEFVGEATTRLPLFDGVHEEELEFAAHSFLGEGAHRDGGRFNVSRGGGGGWVGGVVDGWRHFGGGHIVVWGE